ncbi:MAG: Ig-like domain repeat protein, partial [Pseudomonadota bacterium]|nr:Ig-like domain repeat protein [Pseudomonadota bacterium]
MKSTHISLGEHPWSTTSFAGRLGLLVALFWCVCSCVLAQGGFANLGFEAPNLAGGYQYAPSGTTWSFVGAGITGNGNAFTSGNAGAPQGAQVAFIQGNPSSVSQTASLAGGQYTISFSAAQRGNYQYGTQVIQVQVDGALVGQYQPPGVAYTTYQTAPFSVATTGNHTIALIGAGSGSDFTAFVDDLRINAAQSAAPTTTTVVSSPNPANVGTTVTFTVTVNGTAPTGSVNFSDGGSSIAGCSAVALTGSGNSRTAACNTSSLSAATHTILASYSGDAANAGSSSSALSQVINAQLTSFANLGFETPNLAGGYEYAPSGATWSFVGAGITGNGNAFTSGNASAPQGAQVAFVQNAASSASQTASLAAGQYTVSFSAAQRGNYQSGTQIVQVQVDGALVGQYQPPGLAYTTYQTAPFTINTTGNHTISLIGAGSGSDFTAFVDDVRINAVQSAAPTTIALVSSANPANVGASVTFTATVTGAAPSGRVNFTDNGSSIASCGAVTLTGSGNSRTAICNAASLTAGTHNIVAAYAGDGANSASSSSGLSQVVDAAASTSRNVALATAGGVASASSIYSGQFPISAINNNERAGANWGTGGGWNDGTLDVYPDWVQIDFAGPYALDHVVIYTVQDNYGNPVEPDDMLTFSLYGITDFVVQAWDGSAWMPLSTVTGNRLVKRTVSFPPFTTNRIRISITSALASYSRITEVEAWTSSGNTGLSQTTSTLVSSL